ncbi:MAG: hypothetical protein A3G93_04670 [Nitrospinae bacterium RIFCSPLOWO2_12_FULL_45_22]|nr:MAG: hypothetical protein A3G93_04670 [Nitrospinae bacterium RIFCSPLOWO2_12_FULL_45_22]
MYKKLKRKHFYKYIEQWEPLPNQFMEDHTWRKLKKKPMHYALFNRVRFYHTLRFALKYLHSAHPVILDIGVYPGTLLCILSDLLRRYDLHPVFWGVGLSITSEFTTLMEKRYKATIKTVNLDPDNPDLKGKPYTSRILFEDNSVDMIFATEIVEHLTNPNHLLSEAHRLLKSSGVIIITTPNVSRIGSVFKLLIGRSNYDRLMLVGYSNPEDEWRPHFREYSMDELNHLLGERGFEVIDATFFSDHTEFVYKDIKQKLIDLAKAPFELIPHLRGDILIIGKKN